MQRQPQRVREADAGIAVSLSDDGAQGNESLTPAQRVALTIAFLNHGVDVVDQAARTCLTGCARRIARPRGDIETDHRVHGAA